MDAAIVAWSDHGFRVAHQAQRRTLTDSSLFNQSATGTVASIFVGSEDDAAASMMALGAEYVLVLYGGVPAPLGSVF